MWTAFSRTPRRIALVALVIAACVLLVACGTEADRVRACDTGPIRTDLPLDLTFERASVFPPYDDYVNEEGTGLDAEQAVVSDPVRTGEGSLRLRLPASEGNKSRSQLQVPTQLSFHSGDEYWYGISLYIGEDWDLSQVDDTGEQFGALFSFRWRDISSDANGPGNGIVLDRLDDGRVHFVSRRETRGWEYPDGGGPDTIDLGPVVKGQWVDFVIHIKWSARPEGGLREYWRDGELMGRSTKQNMGTDSPVINRMGLYQGPAVDHERTLYWDNHRIGGSFAEVDPACPTAEPEATASAS